MKTTLLATALLAGCGMVAGAPLGLPSPTDTDDFHFFDASFFSSSCDYDATCGQTRWARKVAPSPLPAVTGLELGFEAATVNSENSGPATPDPDGSVAFINASDASEHSTDDGLRAAEPSTLILVLIGSAVTGFFLFCQDAWRQKRQRRRRRICVRERMMAL